MKRDEYAWLTPGVAHGTPPAGPVVVHLVGRITNDVFSFLGPLTQTLAARGMVQVVIAHEAPAFAHNLALFDRQVRLVVLPASKAPLRRLRRMRAALVAEVAVPGAVACHLHGIVPSLVGVWASRVHGLGARMHFSPHGSRSLGPFKLLGSVLMRVLRAAAHTRQLVPIVNSSEDGRRVAPFSDSAPRLIESPVAAEFFEVPRRESPAPMVLAGVGLPDPAAAWRLAQLAVLVWDDSSAVRFVWVGPLDDEAAERLRAAKVDIRPAATQSERASLMSESWCFLALGKSEGCTSVLAEAMAAGLPCVGWEHARHRDLIEEGRTGAIVADEVSAVGVLSELLGSDEARLRWGAAARASASIRFDRGRFDKAVCAAYGCDDP